MCDVLVAPGALDGKEVIVSGSMVLAFEHASLGCATESSEEKMRSVWISFDLASIEEASPDFMGELKRDIDRGNRWSGEARRNIIVRGRIRFSDQALKSQELPPFAGFGHLGSAPGEIVVTEIIKYGPNQAPEPTPHKRRGSP